MAAERIDVLAVMDYVAERLTHRQPMQKSIKARNGERLAEARAAVADAFAAMDAAVTRLDSIGCRASCAPNDDAETAGRELTRIMRDAYETRDTLRAALARVQGEGA